MINVTGIGIISALGNGVKANLDFLLGHNSKETIHLPRNFKTNINVPVGEVDSDNDELKRLLGIDVHKVVSRTSLLGIMACREAIRDAALTDLSHVAFISSTTVGGMDLTPAFYRDFMADPSRGRLRYVAQHDCASSTNAIADACGLGGFRTAISTACSSAANAIMMGCRLIEQGLASTVVVGGVDALCAYTVDGFKSLMILDENNCRPFDASRAGLNLGEGAGFLVLQDCEGSRQTYCAVTGFANANDAFHQTAVSADAVGPQLAMRQALSRAGLQPADISYINAHGTGTPNNDASESAALKAIWANCVPPFSSTKSVTGHTLAAAGAIEAVFSVLAIAHQTCWANSSFSSPIPETNLTPVTTPTPCEVKSVMSNSFGFGGNCTSVIFSRLDVAKCCKSVLCSSPVKLYINAFERFDDSCDLKSLIPDANMRRRMSRLVKMGVAAGLKASEGFDIDSIITATSYGCLTDSEKFLHSAISTDEQMLSPTPFIQSTFNTVGGTIAVIRGNHNYNMTFVNRRHCLSDMVIDASLEIASGKHNVLIGLIDEMTPTLSSVFSRMRHRADMLPHDDGAWFYVISDKPSASTLLTLEVSDLNADYDLRKLIQ